MKAKGFQALGNPFFMQKNSLYQHKYFKNMLNTEEARRAILSLYDSIENFEVGNPVPFVRSYSTVGFSPIDDFNELMKPTRFAFTKIFYGSITWGLKDEGTGGAVTTQIITTYYLDLIGDKPSESFNVIRNFTGSTTESYNGTTNGLFIQEVVFTEDNRNCNISLEGYIFEIAQQDS